MKSDSYGANKKQAQNLCRSCVALSLTQHMYKFCAFNYFNKHGSFKSLPQGIASAASLQNILTDWNAKIEADLNLIKNMDDWMLQARNLVELEQKLEKFLQFAASKNLKLKTKKFIVGNEVEFGG